MTRGSATSLLCARDVTVTHDGAVRAAPAGASLDVAAGEVMLLLGPSGCGKSTLALCCNGLIPHSVPATRSGSVTVAGHDTTHVGPATLCRHVGLVFQDPDAQLVTMTCADEVAFGLENLCVDPDDIEPRIVAALEQVGLADRADDSPDVLSGGGRQRLALASVLALEPQVLILDEPTANLDPAGSRDVLAVVARLAAHGHAVVLIEHDLDTCIELVDRVVALDASGGVLTQGTPREVLVGHGDQLAEAGIWLPDSVRLGRRLAECGVALDVPPVTTTEATRAVATLLADGAPPLTTARTGPVSPRVEATVTAPTPDTDPPSAFSVTGLSWWYGDRQVLDDVHLDVAAGDMLAIVGANGAGKTTLACAMMGLLDVPRDTVRVDGVDITRLGAQRISGQVGYVFQNPEHQFVTERVGDELAWGLSLRGFDADQAAGRIEDALDRFGLRRYRDVSPFTLSHGQKRRLSVATMLVAGQSSLILDEPTFGQDAANADALMAMFADLNAAGVGIVLITHDMRLVAEHARRVAVLDDGRVAFDGTPTELFAQPQLLADAALDLPPAARIVAPLTAAHPHLAGCVTVDNIVTALVADRHVAQGS